MTSRHLRRVDSAFTMADIAEATDSPFTITTREELLNALHEATQVEHGLMLQYLYAAFTLKPANDPSLEPDEGELVRVWKATLLGIAREEMAHLATVCNLINAIGGTPDFVRPNFPQPHGRWFPFDFQLERLTHDSIARFVRFEAPKPSPEDLLLGLAPQPVDFDYVGELYGAIKTGFQRLDAALDNLFIGSPDVQDGGDWTAGMRIFPIRNNTDVTRAIDFVVEQGEGTPNTSDPQSHYSRFLSIQSEMKEREEGGSPFDPARNVLLNPLTRVQRDAGQGANLIDPASPALRCAELFNHLYSTMLMMLTQYYDPAGETAQQRDDLQACIRRMMSAILRPLGETLATLPASADPSGPCTGPTFEIYSPIGIGASVDARYAIVRERAALAAQECGELAEALGVARLAFIGDNIGLLVSALNK